MTSVPSGRKFYLKMDDLYGTSNGFLSFASELAKQISHDAIELSVSAVETAKFLAQESSIVVEKAAQFAHETLAEHFPDEMKYDDDDMPPEDIVMILPWINDDGSVNEDVQDQVLEISWDLANFQVLTKDELEPIFDIDRYLLIAPQLLAFDAHLRQRHFESARKIPEDVFWGNYFYHCHAARIRYGLSPYVEMSSRCIQLPTSPLSSTASESLPPFDRSNSDFSLDSPEPYQEFEFTTTPEEEELTEDIEQQLEAMAEVPAKRKLGIPTRLKRSMSACKERLSHQKYMEKLASLRRRESTGESLSEPSKSRFQKWSQTSQDIKSSLHRHSASEFLKKRPSLPSSVKKLSKWVPSRAFRSKSLSVSELEHLREIQARLDSIGRKSLAWLCVRPPEIIGDCTAEAFHVE
ncbi:hypothetical protein THRCLA_07603 [Thraustotheca clavata]|uniref:BSD domain-containing protein n=1 Tax=Thraustotheca clavata TaxID=74557 RepID=A0A1V9ZCS7_9STRA|nr:hypothetical protein THRCLA_07603 [Thraustotheca clavata]